MTTLADLTVGDIGRRVRVIHGESVLVGLLRGLSVQRERTYRFYSGPAHYTYSISLQVGQFDITAQRDTLLDFLEEDE